jgi:hypothetical protein
MPQETIVAGWTVKQFDAAFKAVSEHWRRKGCHEERRELGRSLFGRSIEYRFYQGGAEIVRWELRPRAAGVLFVVRLRDADIYDTPDWDRFAWQTKEAIWRDVMIRMQCMFPNKGPTRVEGKGAEAQAAAGKARAGAPATSERFLECVRAVEVALEPGDPLNGAEPELATAWQAGGAPEVQRASQGTAAQPHATGGATPAQDAQPQPHAEAAPQRRRGRKRTDPQEINKICAAWYKAQDRVTQENFCNGRGISVSSLRSWLKHYPYPDS